MEIEQFTPLQSNCLSVIAELDEPRKSAINKSLLEQYDFHGNSGTLQFALLALIDCGLVERHQQGEGSTSYSLTERGERRLRTAQ